jgi:hypothetical protein
MSDKTELQKIIDDTKKRASYCLATARTDEWVTLGKLVEQLEALPQYAAVPIAYAVETDADTMLFINRYEAQQYCNQPEDLMPLYKRIEKEKK